jgi:hypothetical protein
MVDSDNWFWVAIFCSFGRQGFNVHFPFPDLSVAKVFMVQL